MVGRDIRKAIEEIAAKAGESLEREMIEAWARLTREEVVDFAAVSDHPGNLSPDKLAKTLLLAVASDVLDNEFNAESIKPNATKVRRIIGRNQ